MRPLWGLLVYSLKTAALSQCLWEAFLFKSIAPYHLKQVIPHLGGKTLSKLLVGQAPQDSHPSLDPNCKVTPSAPGSPTQFCSSYSSFTSPAGLCDPCHSSSPQHPLSEPKFCSSTRLLSQCEVPHFPHCSREHALMSSGTNAEFYFV